MTPSEIYAVNFQNPEPKYYTRTPNILSHLTYDEIDEDSGEITKKKLSVYARELYRVLREHAGDYGACWRNRDGLAELCNMSAGSISKAKEELLKNFNELDGTPLINIEKRTRKSQHGAATYDLITIMDIWRWNNAFMATLKMRKASPSPSLYDNDEVAPSPHDGPKVAPSPHDKALEVAPSPHDTNKNKDNNNHLSKEQQTALSVSVCPLDSAVSLSVAESDVQSRQKAEAFNWFTKIGCDVFSATQFVEKYSTQDIIEASGYVQKQLAIKKSKNETIGNIVGYLRKTLEGKYWQQQKK